MSSLFLDNPILFAIDIIRSSINCKLYTKTLPNICMICRISVNQRQNIDFRVFTEYTNIINQRVKLKFKDNILK